MIDLFQKKQIHTKKEYCLALILKEKEGSVMAIKIDKMRQSVDKIDEKSIHFSESWDLIPEHVDDALFQLEHDNDCVIKEVIFFLYAHIIDQKNKRIKTTYFQHIKNTIKTLDLKPLGYIDYQEAVSIYFSEKEHTAFTAMIVEIDVHVASLFVYQNGVLVFSESLKRGDTITTDIEKLFISAQAVVLLPSRILIYDSCIMENAVETIVAHQWSEKFFVQIPQFEILSENQLLTALFFAFTEQLFEKNQAIKEARDETPPKVLGFTIGDKNQRQEFRQETEIKEQKVKSEKKNILVFVSQGVQTLAYMIKTLLLKSRLILFFPVLIGLIIIVSFVMLYFFHKAEIVVEIQSKLIEKQLNIDGAIGEPLNKNILTVKISEQTVEKNETVNTTGKITIGEMARGEATFYNLLEQEKIFKKNTIFISDKNVQFFLDDDVKLASASSTFTSDGNKLTVTGKNKISLTAEKIGTEGNIDKDQKLRVEDFPLSSYFASPLNSFTGGTKKDVQTVSKDDLQKLKDSALTHMAKEKDGGVKNTNNSQMIIDQLTTAKITDESYSKELGEEAKNVSLHAKGTVLSYSYGVDDIRRIITDFSSDFIPVGYHVPSENIEYMVTDARIDDTEKIHLALNIKEHAVMKVEQNQIVQELKGKDTDELSKILKEKYKIQTYTTEVQSPFFFLKSRLPFFTKNITLTVHSQ